MSLSHRGRVQDRTEALYQTWLGAHSEEMDALNWTRQHERRNEIMAQLQQQAAAEIAAAEQAQSDQFIDAIWQSELASDVHQFYAEMAERRRLEAERDARIAAITAEYVLPHPWDHIEQYNEGRARLLLERVAAQGLEICFRCCQAKPDVTFVLLDGRATFSHTDCMSRQSWVATYQYLEHLCRQCRANEHQPITPEQLSGPSENIEYCFVRPAEDREDGTYVDYDGIWRPAPSNAEVRVRHYTGTGSISDRLATEWNIPPELKASGDTAYIYRSFEDNIAVAEPVTV